MTEETRNLYDVLTEVQAYLAKEYTALLGSNENETLLKSYISHYLQQNKIMVQGYTQEKLMQRLIDEMMGYSLLSEYLASNEVEEVNINGWKNIEISYSGGKSGKAKEHFKNASHAVDVVRRMLRASNMVWDNAQPIQVGHLPGNIRITAVGFDVTDVENGLSVSIRKVNGRKLQKEDFVRQNTATDEMMTLLALLYRHGVSMCFTGATGSGKTTLLSWVLTSVPYHKRLITIEQGTREFNCEVLDEAGIARNNVVHLSTRLSDDDKQSITQVKLIETIMTMNPDYIAVGESKGEEAMQTINAANTGHAVITTTHANSAEDTYFRLISLCKLKYPNMDEALLKTLAVRAFPVVVYVKKLEDNTRKVLQINEAVQGEDGNITYKILYRYAITKTVVTGEDVHIEGHFEKVCAPSDALKQRLVENGLPAAALASIFAGGDA